MTERDGEVADKYSKNNCLGFDGNLGQGGIHKKRPCKAINIIISSELKRKSSPLHDSDKHEISYCTSKRRIRDSEDSIAQVIPYTSMAVS